MPRPQLALVLHAHLPWVRHPEEPQFHEESWLFEALIECYLPLCEGMRDWTRRGWPWRLALSVSPTLAASLSDALLRERFERHFSAVIELAGREVDRHLVQPDWRAVAEFYRERLTRLRNLWWALGGEVLAEWRRLQESGHL